MVLGNISLCDKNKCTGCGACISSCQHKCIFFKYDKDGFMYPVVGDNCVQCGSCLAVCPIIQHPPQSPFLLAYKAKSLSGEIIMGNSSSGGVFPELALNILKHNGVVFGACFNESFTEVYHCYITSLNELYKLQGSKYIQSNTADIFRKVKNMLKSEKLVLFSGTPCQIAGLKTYLKKDYSNLYTMDFICHGVASTKIFNLYIDQIRDGRSIRSLDFRNKDDGYMMENQKINSNFKITFIDGTEHSVKWYDCSLGFAFANNIINRESCSICQYASVWRVSDITVADYRGPMSQEDMKTGISLVLINTKKGESLFESIKLSVYYELQDKNTVIGSYLHLAVPAKKHKNRQEYFQNVDVLGYDKASEKYFSKYKEEFSFYRFISRAIRIIRKLHHNFDNMFLK